MKDAGNKRKPPECPECGKADRVVPIAYGLPGPEMAEASFRGEIELGGCVVGGDDPHWSCRRCDTRW